jgi:predicted heme/steroid binding protein
VEFDVTGSQTLVGMSYNTFTYTFAQGVNADNYTVETVEGTLTVANRSAKYVIYIEANSGQATYDGTEHTVSGFETTQFEFDGKTYTVSGLTAVGAGTNAGYYDVAVTGTAVVTDAAGNVVTDQFAVYPKTGSLYVAKRYVEFATSSASKAYDGAVLVANGTSDAFETARSQGFVTGQGAKVNITGAQLLPGSSANNFDVVLDGNTQASNYTIVKVPGTLTVTDRAENKYMITVTANSDRVQYDANEHVVEGLISNVVVAANGQAYTVVGAEAKGQGKHAGEYKVDVDLSAARVYDRAGNDVTAQFNIVGQSGLLTVTERIIKLETSSAEKQYDGLALVANGAADVWESADSDGFVPGEGAAYVITGTQTQVGSSDNTVELTFDESTTLASNYIVVVEPGMLTVTAAPYTPPAGGDNPGNTPGDGDGEGDTGEGDGDGDGDNGDGDDGDNGDGDTDGTNPEPGEGDGDNSDNGDNDTPGTNPGDGDNTPGTDGNTTPDAGNGGNGGNGGQVTPSPTNTPAGGTTPTNGTTGGRTPGAAATGTDTGTGAGNGDGATADAEDGVLEVLADAEEAIEDNETPLASAEEAAHANCWVHWFMILGMILTVLYAVVVAVRRAGFTGKLNKMASNQVSDR